MGQNSISLFCDMPYMWMGKILISNDSNPLKLGNVMKAYHDFAVCLNSFWTLGSLAYVCLLTVIPDPSILGTMPTWSKNNKLQWRKGPSAIRMSINPSNWIYSHHEVPDMWRFYQNGGIESHGLGDPLWETSSHRLACQSLGAPSHNLSNYGTLLPGPSDTGCSPNACSSFSHLANENGRMWTTREPLALKVFPHVQTNPYPIWM